jgi:Protein of unknown function (DUF2384)
MKNTKEKESKAARPSKSSKPPVDPLPAIDPSLLTEVEQFLDDADGWFRTPNMTFEGRAPIELLGTPEESRIRERIEAAKYGLYT